MIVEPRWAGRQCVVAASGPSLTEDVAARCGGQHVVAVNDAYRRLPSADVLYACDAAWWHAHQGCPSFRGEKWSTHDDRNNDKREVAAKYGVRLVAGADGEGFSLDPSLIHYGPHLSGFHALNMALLFGATRILLVGFDMHDRRGRHFFGPHPAPLSNALRFEAQVPAFREAAKTVPPGVEIVNCTPNSELTCFPFVPLEAALEAVPA